MEDGNFANVEESRNVLRAKQDAMQKRTFTKWYNSYLKHREITVNDLTADMHDAVILINLLEIISSEKLGKFNKAPKMRVMKLENAGAALEFIKKRGLKVTGIGPEDLVDGNEKLILGLSWILILRYEIQKFSEDIQELLRWCKARTAGYPNVRVQNFTESFNDGLAFCALIHKHYPNLLDFDSLSPAAHRENLDLAFEIAEKEFGVPKLLDTQDMLDGPDEKSVITYVAKLRQAFSAKDQEMSEAARLAELRRLQEEEEARRRAAEEAERQRREQELRAAADALNSMFPGLLARKEHEEETDRLKGEFGPRADDLAQWITNADRNLADKLGHVEELTGDQVLASLDDLNNFDNVDKPPRHDELQDLSNLFDVINARLTKEGRPLFDHPNGVKHLNNLWGGMENTERDLRNALLLRAKRLSLVLPLIERYRRTAGRLADWQNKNGPAVDSTEFSDSEVGVLGQLREFKRLETDIAPQLALLRSLDNLGRQIKQQDNASFGEEVDSTSREAHAFYDTLQQRASTRRTALQKELERQQRLEEERTQYTRRTNELSALLDEGEELAHHPLESIDTADSLRQYFARLDAAVDAIHQVPPPQGFDVELVQALLSRVDFIRQSLRERAGLAEQAAERLHAEAALNRSVDTSARDFKAWHTEAARSVAVLLDDIATQTKEPAHSRLEALRRNVSTGQDKVEQLRALSQQLGDLSAAHTAAQQGASSSSPSALALAQSAQEARVALSNAESLLRHHQSQIDRLQAEIQQLDSHHLTVPNVPAVRQALKTLGNNGVVEESNLRDRGIREEHIGFLRNQVPNNAPNGGLDYESFDPYKGRTFTPPVRRFGAAAGAVAPAPSTPVYSAASPAATAAKAPAAAAAAAPAAATASAAPASPATSAASVARASYGRQNSQTGPTSSSFVAGGSPAPSAATSSPYRTAPAYGASPAAHSPAATTSRPSSSYNDYAAPASPSYTTGNNSRPSSYVAPSAPAPAPAAATTGGSGIGPDIVVNGTRESAQIEDSVFLYTTQSDDLPVIVKYELQCNKQKRVDFTISTEGSQNIEVVWPVGGDGVKASASIGPFETKTVAVLRQIDSYATASLRVKYSWKAKDA